MKEYKFPKTKVTRAYQKIRKAYLKASKQIPNTFSMIKHNSLAKEHILEQFPLEHYGKDIDGIVFEGWSLRGILESTFNAGYLRGQNPQKWKDNNKECLRLARMLETFRFKVGNRSFHPTDIKPLCIEEGFLVFEVALPDALMAAPKKYRVDLKEYQAEHKRVMKKVEKILNSEL